jgi:hypothetical protein
LSIVFDLERTNQLNLLPDKDLVDLCPPIEPYQVTKNHTSDHLDLPEWYEPPVEASSKLALPNTTLWFWNSEIGWAVVHPILEKFGWRYVNCNIWNKGKGHIAGNVNTEKIRRFPVVTEVCVQYVREVKIGLFWFSCVNFCYELKQANSLSRRCSKLVNP